MTDSSSSSARVRAGDEEASAELVRTYEPAIRVAVRARLTDPRLRRLLDSTDVCQSVLGNFFDRAGAGQFELKDPKQLVALLVTMARNRITNHALQQQAARRDHRRGRTPAGESDEPVRLRTGPRLGGGGPGPAGGRPRPDVGRGAGDRRAVGLGEWVGGDRREDRRRPDTLRIRLGRAFDRVRRELGLLK